MELGCRAPAIETGPFPDTPSGLFWSSTPDRNTDGAIGVHFLVGSIYADRKTANARVRRVRTGAQPPVQPLPALHVGVPLPIVEGDNGITHVVFPIGLDRAALTDVTVQYRTADDLAHASEDYQSTSGTLVSDGTAIAGTDYTPIGTTITFGDGDASPRLLAVPTLDDTVAESDRTVNLALSDPGGCARWGSPAQC